MTAHINTMAFAGIEVVDVDVQVHMSAGLPAFTIVGLPDKTIAESRERVRAALNSIGLQLPAKRIIINLAPADLLKEGSHFDLAIACGLLASMNILPQDQLEHYLVMGELSLNAGILPVAGVLPAALGASGKGKGIICPKANGKEAAWSGNQMILAADNIISLINHFKGTQIILAPEPDTITSDDNFLNIADIKGQDVAKRALEIAACGGHNLLMNGPPGTGKSMLAKRLAGILPKMDAKEILECSMISSIAGQLVNGKLQDQRPFRAPHHSCSMAAMVGGGMGRRINPGEISLAHNGVLFLDELPEFPRAVLDSLRQSTETGEISIARANAHVTFPAKFQLVAAMNPCKCGYLGDKERGCSRSPKCATDYQAKISGPILDRIDLHAEVPNLNSSDLIAPKKGEDTKKVAERVAAIRQMQIERFDGYNIKCNNELEGQVLEEFATPDPAGQNLLLSAVEKFKLSMRGYHRILKVARTIADIENVSQIKKEHISEALSFRQFYSKSSN